MITNTFTTIDNKYIIDVYGNGWAYEVTSADDDELNLWFQDHDAEQLQKETNDFENTDYIDQQFECNFS